MDNIIKENKNKERNIWWMQFLISVLGTAIGVGLTFGISHRIENKKKEQAQRMTAMMVIHDIDETIDKLRLMKVDVENGYYATMYTMEHLNQIDSVPTDTLYAVINFLLSDDQDFRFDDSKEKIFHSSPDSWQNLGSMKFIDNVQSFYFDRQTFQELCNKSDIWCNPISMKEIEKIQVKNDNLSIEQYIEQYNSLLRDLLKNWIDDDRVQYFITYSAYRIAQIVKLIEEWTSMNNENKFLMSITDEELEEYVNSINQNGIALTENSLFGTWILSSTEENSLEWEFDKDHNYSIVTFSSQTVKLPFCRGKLKVSIAEKGTWSLEGDSLVQMLDINAFDVKVDVSDMSVFSGRQEVFDDWLKGYEEDLLTYYQKQFSKYTRATQYVRLDASRDKMEMKGTGVNDQGEKEQITWYLKRKK